jgi:hypothetical protein
MLGRSTEHRWAKPMTQQQRNFDVGPVVGNGSATTFDRAPYSVFHRVDVQMELVSSRRVA